MGILFWIIFFVVIGSLWGQVKKAWGSGETLKAVAWLVLAVVVFVMLGFFRQVIMEQNRKEWQGQIQSQFVQIFDYHC